MANPPSVYIFHGEDANAIREAVSNLQSKLGDATTAEMNTTRLEGNPSLAVVRTAAQAVPFLAPRRLVVTHNLVKSFSKPEERKRLADFLDAVPPTTALVLVEGTAFEDRHWLMKWADAAEGRAFVRQFDLPKGPQMANWLVLRAKELGGEIQPAAAAALAQLLGSDKSAAEHELDKLLAYANYARPITAADVQLLCLPSGEHGDFFGLIDALSAGNGARAMQALQALLEERDLILLYFSLVGHFRALLQTRDLLDRGLNDVDISKQLGMHPYRAQKLAGQAKRFSMDALRSIYSRLLAYDEQIKTGELEPELAMETFIAELSAQLA